MPLQAQADLQPAQRYGLIGAVLAVHALGLWGLLQVGAVRDAVQDAAPLVVDFISVAAPPRPVPPAPAPAPLRPQPVTQAAPAPQFIAAPPAAFATLSPAPFVVPPAVDPVPVPVPTPATPTTTAAAAPAPPAAPVPSAPAPAPPQPRMLPAGNVTYLVPPPIELPLASRRLGEQGVVLLRVLVDIDGLPRQVSVQRSSGFVRLDEQALSAMKRARFKPQTDNGAPIEWIVVAPLQYEIE